MVTPDGIFQCDAQSPLECTCKNLQGEFVYDNIGRLVLKGNCKECNMVINDKYLYCLRHFKELGNINFEKCRGEL